MADPAPEQNPELATKIRFDVPHSARIWNYWMGGKDNYPVDRAVGDAGIAVYPDIVTEATQSRQFIIRTVRFLAGECGVRQFLDIGTGLPTMQNTHEVAQSVAPDSRVVYVDNDPLVLAHARALLTNTTPEGVTAYVDADLHNPELILSDARNVLNFNLPIGIMLIGVLGHVADFEEARSIIARVLDAVPSGSYLVLSDGTDLTTGFVELCTQYAESGGVPYTPRGLDQLRRYFEGLDLVEPGLVAVSEWRQDTVEVGTTRPIATYGAVARKP